MVRELDTSDFTAEECVSLAVRLWEQARAHPEHIPVTDAQLNEMNRRLDALENSAMEPGESWETVRARLWK